jgi:hypothetical protein
MRLKSLLACTYLMLVALPVFAQQNPGPPPKWFHGTIETLTGDTLAVKSPNGETVSFMLAPKVKIVFNVKKSLHDIKPGDFVGSAGVMKDGKLYAQEVHIFPADMRGTAEGQRPMGPSPARSMTNATVSAIAAPPKRSMTNATVADVSSAAGTRMLKLQYKGGEAVTIVGPDVPILEFVAGDTSLLKAGAAVLVLAIKTDKGPLAVFINVEKDGVMPLSM